MLVAAGAKLERKKTYRGRAHYKNRVDGGVGRPITGGCSGMFGTKFKS